MPFAKTKPKKELHEQTLEISGAPKLGKTELASHFPKPVFMLTEPGQGGRELVHWKPANWKSDEPYIIKSCTDFDNAYIELCDATNQFQTVIIDTVDNMANVIADDILKENAVESLNEGAIAYGRGHSIFEKRFRTYLHQFAKLPMGLVMISHQKEVSISRPGKEPLTAWRDTLNDRAKLIVQSMADMILMVRKEGKERFIYTEGDLSIEAGSRIALPERIPMGKSGTEAYQNLVTAFYGKNGNKKLAKDELVTRILKAEAYLAENKIDSFDTDKRANNSRLKHLLFEDIEKASIENMESYLQHLKNKALAARKEK